MSVQVVADIDNDLEVGVFLGAYRQLAQRQDLETRRLCAESCAAVLKAATPRRSANVEIQAFLHPKPYKIPTELLPRTEAPALQSFILKNLPFLNFLLCFYLDFLIISVICQLLDPGNMTCMLLLCPSAWSPLLCMHLNTVCY